MYNGTEIDFDDNAILVQNTLESFLAKKPDLHNESEVKQAIEDYFKRCISKGLRPGNLGLYNALGINKKQAYDLLHGLTPKKASPASVEQLKKACDSLGEYRESLGSHNKITPPVLIFWEKNFDHLEDVQRVELDANSAPKSDVEQSKLLEMMEEEREAVADYKEL